ncbi:phenazine-specific anthranilate synthase component I [Streptomyces xiaopingdaonensis]|uniref:phenazine-specific anthranilate synthase component I n=1 Tax=Streptomyces xiaopingdaonensis TaxID=1565415 RepID=UPI0002F72261|nr:phenazine-specific anthranilate synthase component I [Streptomyces xiaopingdaonensis]
MSPAAERSGSELLEQVLATPQGPFALLHRPDSADPDSVDVLLGTLSMPGSLAELPLPAAAPAPQGPRQDVLAVVPYRQIAERGFACVDDGAPLLALSITEQGSVGLAELAARVPRRTSGFTAGRFRPSDEAYARLVRRVVDEEIGSGEGANFVLKRSFTAQLADYGPHTALLLFQHLLERESGAYWTFLVHTGDRTFVGASPERHVSLRDGRAVMNPISGTYRYPGSGPDLPGIMEFLGDRKETDELFMVLDEELKMMARICESGGRVTGPRLKEMARLAHTEYLIEGESRQDPRTVLRETLLAPTVTGSPLESACRVIARREPAGRGYYSGVAALVGRDEQGDRTLDSTILIRTADIDARGRVEIGVGATLVRHSDPRSEVAETAAKAAGLLSALGGERPQRFGTHPAVREALRRRNAAISGFWQSGHARRRAAAPLLDGRKALVVDAEDTFTAMLDHQLSSLGLDVTVRRYDEPYALDGGWDLVVMGPGPGDPRQLAEPKIRHLEADLRRLLAEERPFLAVCLSHQVLAGLLGLPLHRRETPNQGLRQEIDLFGTREEVGFYNAFSALSTQDKIESEAAGLVEVSREAGTGEVRALRARRFASLQFHPESVLTHEGPRILAGLLTEVLAP